MKTLLPVLLLFLIVSCSTTSEVTSFAIPNARLMLRDITSHQPEQMKQIAYFEGKLKIISPPEGGVVVGVDQLGDGTYENFVWLQSAQPDGMNQKIENGQLLFMGASFIVNDTESDNVHFFSISNDDKRVKPVWDKLTKSLKSRIGDRRIEGVGIGRGNGNVNGYADLIIE